MPCNYADYHPDWKSIVRQIKDQAGDRCEFCGAPNGSDIVRNKSGGWMRVDDLSRMKWRSVWDWLGTFPTFPDEVRIVLTVAHLCHDPSCYDPTHLRALCQSCHLRHDAKHHARNAAETRRRRRIEAGQAVMV